MDIITPDPIPVPAAGQSFRDPVFGATIKRISDAADAGVGWVTQEYSTMSPWNCDNSRLLLQHQDHFAVYSGEGDFIADAPDFAADCEPRWALNDPGCGYIRRANTLLRSSLEGLEVIQTFRQFSKISGMGEGDLGADGRTMALCGDGVVVFLYDVIDREVCSAGMMPMSSVDGLYVTASGNLLVTFRDARGIRLYDREFRMLRQLAPVGGHCDVCRDLDGSEILVWTNSNDPRPIACRNSIVKIDLATGQQTCLLELDWSLAVHISCPDASGSCLVETYAAPDAPWVPYSNEILKVALDGSGAQRLCHHRSLQLSYNSQPRVSCSRDGSRFVFSSNFGVRDRGEHYTDVYMVELLPEVRKIQRRK